MDTAASIMHPYFIIISVTQKRKIVTMNTKAEMIKNETTC